LANYQHTREISRWANESKVGDVSPIITVDNKYFFVVALTGIHEEGYASLNEVYSDLESVIVLEKKGAKLAEEAKAAVAGASTIEEVAEKLNTTVSNQSGVAFSSLVSQQLDPKFIGAIAGFVVSRTINLIGGGGVVPEQNFVLVGMAGLMAGVMQAPMTAIFLIADMTGGYELLIPLILTSTVSYAMTRAIEPYSIYTKRIAKKGELLTHDSDQAVLTLLKTNDLIEADFHTVRIDATLGELVEVVATSRRNIFPVVDSRNHFQGFVSLEDIRRDMFKKDLYKTQHVFNFMKSAPAYVYVDEKMDSVMRKFEQTDAWNLPVVERDRTYVGFVSKSKIFSAYRDQLKQVSHD
jgi:CIC family chloride channel protein